MNYRHRSIIYGGIVIGCDQVSKLIATRLDYIVLNPYSAFSIPIANLIVTYVMIGALGLLVFVSSKSSLSENNKILLYVMIAAGISNIYDRIVYNAVRDIMVGSFLINIADLTLISCGAILIFKLYTQRKNKYLSTNN